MQKLLLAFALMFGLTGTGWAQGITITVNAGEPKVDAAGKFVANGSVNVPANVRTVDQRTGDVTTDVYFIKTIKVESLNNGVRFANWFKQNIQTATTNAWQADPQPVPAGSTSLTRKVKVTVTADRVVTVTPGRGGPPVQQTFNADVDKTFDGYIPPPPNP